MLNCSECKNNCCINTQGTVLTSKHEAKAKDDEIRRLNNLYADTIKDLGEVLIEIERLKEQLKANDELLLKLETLQPKSCEGCKYENIVTTICSNCLRCKSNTKDYFLPKEQQHNG